MNQIKTNTLKRWMIAIIAALILCAGLLYICGLIFFNAATNSKTSSPNTVKHSYQTLKLDTNAFSPAYQWAIAAYERAKRNKDNSITWPKEKIEHPPLTTPPTYTTSPVENKLSLPENIFSSVKFTSPHTGTLDGPPTRVVRIPPIMPPHATKSGHCKVRFDTKVDGSTHNIETVFCTEDIFKDPTLTAVAKWVFQKKDENGIFVTRTGEQQTVRYKLVDKAGNIIPE